MPLFTVCESAPFSRHHAKAASIPSNLWITSAATIKAGRGAMIADDIFNMLLADIERHVMCIDASDWLTLTNMASSLVYFVLAPS